MGVKMLPKINMFKLSALTLGISGLALSACSSHSSGTRYASTSAAHGYAGAGCYAECGVRWVNRVVAIPTTHTIETKYVEQPPTVEYVDREVIKEVIVEKEVYIDRPVTTPCPTISYPQPEYHPPAPQPVQDCYPEPVTPWTPPPVLRK